VTAAVLGAFLIVLAFAGWCSTLDPPLGTGRPPPGLGRRPGKKLPLCGAAVKKLGFLRQRRVPAFWPFLRTTPLEKEELEAA